MKSVAVRFKWFRPEGDMTLDEILAMEGSCRPDSLVAAIYEALWNKAAVSGTEALSAAEQIVLCAEQMRAEVDNGGFYDFFYNATAAVLGRLVTSLTAIGCVAAAANAERALNAAGLLCIDGDEAIDAQLACEDPQRDAVLQECDSAFHGHCAQIESALLACIKQNRHDIVLVPVFPPPPG
jgi:hypothetical protein